MTTARRFALIAAALLPMAVTAQEATPEPARPAATLDRAQVRQALDDARRNGGMKVFRAGYVGEAATNRSRADVMDELRQARASGELAVLNAEAVAFEQPRAAGEAARYMALVRGR